jgi:SAM-dependent methyltransferase
MIKTLKNLIRCPYCLSPINKYIVAHRNNNMFWGAATCRCDSYPILNNIVYLKKKPNGAHREAANLIQKQLFHKALGLCLDGDRVENAFTPIISTKTGDLLSNTLFLSLLASVNRRKKSWYLYLKNRKQHVTYSLATAFIPPIKSGTRLDLGCGTGLLLNHFRKTGEKGIHVGVDNSLMLLLMAVRDSFYPDTILLCADVNHGIPVVDFMADSVSVSDALMYVENQRQLIMNAGRTLKPGGRLYLVHVHSAGAENISQGISTTPDLISSYAPWGNTYWRSDGDILQDLTNKCPVTNLFRARTIQFFPKKYRSFSCIIQKGRRRAKKILHSLASGVPVNSFADEPFLLKILNT